jgi:hypothetical protein
MKWIYLLTFFKKSHSKHEHEMTDLKHTGLNNKILIKLIDYFLFQKLHASSMLSLQNEILLKNISFLFLMSTLDNLYDCLMQVHTLVR